MSSFLYFLSGIRTLEEARPLIKRLLPFDEPAEQFSHAPVEAAGPDGQAGLMLTPPQSDGGRTLCGYYPERQTWRACQGFWLGFDTADKPGPADLARDETVGGYRVELGGGQEWVVPIARRWPEGTGLTRTLALDAEGKLGGEILERYRGLWDRATLVWDKFHAAATATPENEAVELTFNEREEWDIAVAALSANYKVGPWEVSALGLLDDRTVGLVLNRLIDLPAYMQHRLAELAAAKKKYSSKTAGG